MNRLLAFALVGLMVTSGLVLTSCQACKKKLGITTTIDNPEKGTPEYVVYKVIEAAIKAKTDEKAGWKLYKKQLHPSEVKAGLVSLKAWRQFRFTTLTRKVHLFTKAEDSGSNVKDSSPVYESAYKEVSDNEKRVKVFVANEGNPEQPTPCKLERTEDGWGVVDGCLN